ncbi:MAG TPA: phenylacetic acid degradation operon negative regulatory protein PaaX [Steroidobacteraceae bacterium]|jgi:phenylacetic acid degradation operon negative regulatory protein|nr:phenylacetic acid degradation operon negative regulatory protein PaaX [Steroidobacteraceae bacterium]
MSSDPLTSGLLQHFRRQSPLRGGSLIITIFGDSIAPRGGSIALASLIALARPFGLTERLVRTSVARLAQDGWLVSQRRGRVSFYSLTPLGLTRFAEATRRIYTESPKSWNRRWTLILLPPELGETRERVRDELAWLGFGQVAPGVLAHPARALEDTRERLRELGVVERVIALEAATEDAGHDQQFARAGWNLDELATRYRRFVRAFEPVRDSVSRATALRPESAFVVRTLLIHEYRKIHLRDPLLPVSLLPRDWVGTDAYELCRELYATVFAGAEQHLSANASTARGALPQPTRAILKRFGGLQLSGQL